MLHEMKLQSRYIIVLNIVCFLLLGLSTVAILLAAGLNLSILAYRYRAVISCYLIFGYNCFLKPLLDLRRHDANEDHKARLERFYSGQSMIYDETRRRLLQGRTNMLRLVAGHLQKIYNQISIENDIQNDAPVTKKVVWLDIGGGTGSNIEQMNTIIPISRFHTIYLIDITPSLCEVAKERFQNLGWKNVEVICQDALEFELPSLGDDVEVGLITLSYSLSMMPKPFPVVDKIHQWLGPNGLLGVADFYTSEKICSDQMDKTRQHSFFTRWFWQLWFETDGVYLHPFRRMYLEYRFQTIKSINSFNWVIKPFFGMPYYIWLGVKEDLGTPSGSALRDTTPEHPVIKGAIVRETYGKTALFDLNRYIYAFTWEDPAVDLQVLDINSSDNILLLTSGGCNSLEYALKKPRRIHSVDMNPCQGHLLELKLAAIKTLAHEDFFQLFGIGCHPKFSELLDTKLAPLMSANAYRFWKSNENFGNLYDTGSSGIAIRAFGLLVKMKGLELYVERLCRASTIEEQVRIWEKHLKRHFFGKGWISLINNYKFAWDALGVPKAQFEMLLREGTAYDYFVNTIQPLIENTLLSQNQYFYHLCLKRSYVGSDVGQCPGYLTKEGFSSLKESSILSTYVLHTDSIVNVLRNRISSPGEKQPCKGTDLPITKAVLMDHLDWFNSEEAHEEIEMLSKRIVSGGKVLMRSASKKPWYLQIYVKAGFQVVPIGIRMSETERNNDTWKAWVANEMSGKYSDDIVKPCIDRVNSKFVECFTS